MIAQELIKNASPNGDEMLLNGKAPLPGQIVKLPNLARTFREVAENGKDGFYKGRVAEAIVDLIQSKGGVMELEDLAKHETSIVEPIHYTYASELKIYEARLYFERLPIILIFSYQVPSKWTRFGRSKSCTNISLT